MASRSGDAESEFFTAGKPKEKELYPDSKSSEQKNIDKAVIEAVKKMENLGKYLKASWGLSKGSIPFRCRLRPYGPMFPYVDTWRSDMRARITTPMTQWHVGS